MRGKTQYKTCLGNRNSGIKFAFTLVENRVIENRVARAVNVHYRTCDMSRYIVDFVARQGSIVGYTGSCRGKPYTEN